MITTVHTPEGPFEVLGDDVELDWSEGFLKITQPSQRSVWIYAPGEWKRVHIYKGSE